MNDRINELDSIRGFGVLVVVTYHIISRADQFTKNYIIESLAYVTSMGWFCLDMFFTLSGFLITTILLRTKGKENYFKNFYARRVLRILPMYFTLIMGVFIFAPLLDPNLRSEIIHSLPILLTFQQNWTIMFVPITGYLWITWSLAVEEQFYFLWPLIVYRLSRETLLKLGVGFIALSFLARVLGVMFINKIGGVNIFGFFFYNSFTRFEQITIGSLLAILMLDDRFKEKIRVYALPIFFIFFSIYVALCVSSPVNTHPASGYVPITIFAYTLTPIFTSGLIAACITHPDGSLVRKVMGNKVLLFFGKYSYSMYLSHAVYALVYFHAFLAAGLRGTRIAVIYSVLVFGTTIITALLTWNFIEKPILDLKRYFEYNK